MNPYDFVPLGPHSSRAPRPGHLVMPETGGIIQARLTTLGPFLIADQRAAGQGSAGQLLPLERGRRIPGSSLKGMIRSMAEMVGGGCIHLSSSLFHRGRFIYKHANAPGGFEPCQDLQRLCVTCRMFGTLVNGEAWKGQIETGEACFQGEGNPKTLPDVHVTVGSPKPDHHAFYTASGGIRGRKAYYHHPKQLILSQPATKVAFGARQTVQVRALEPGQSYLVTLQHRGLPPDAYALLLYALFLEPTLAHKLGWGKPMGFGSVRLEPLALEEIDFRARYRRGGTTAARHYTHADAVNRVAELTSAHRARTDETMVRLRALFAFPGIEGVQWRYPAYDWFKSHPQVSLDAFNQGT